MLRYRAAIALGTLALLASCKFPADPNHAQFICNSDGDCGAGYTCVVQNAEGPLFHRGLCFPGDACKPETCNGKDDDCDGLVDNNLPESGSACDTTGKQVCAAGTIACVNGADVCVGQVLKLPEACDGVTDLDCNGLIGCADPACEGKSACGPGCICHDGRKMEVDCGNGIDNNGNGLIDCDDPDCLGLDCGLPPASGTCARTGPRIPNSPPPASNHRWRGRCRRLGWRRSRRRELRWRRRGGCRGVGCGRSRRRKLRCRRGGCR